MDREVQLTAQPRESVANFAVIGPTFSCYAEIVPC